MEWQEISFGQRWIIFLRSIFLLSRNGRISSGDASSAQGDSDATVACFERTKGLMLPARRRGRRRHGQATRRRFYQN